MILILDRADGALPPYRQWLEDASAPVALLTERPASELERCDTRGYAHVRCFADYATSGRVERSAVELADCATISAVVAVAADDAIRAAALRELLGVEGQRRDEAIAQRDLVALRNRLQRAGLPVLRCGVVQRVSDLYWYGACWGYPLRVRNRRRPGWPTAARLGGEADVIAFTCGGLTPKLETVPSLLVEPAAGDCRQRVTVTVSLGDRPRLTVSTGTDTGCDTASEAAATLARAALTELSPSYDCGWRVELVRAGAEPAWCIDAVVADAADRRAIVRLQAGLAAREVAA